MTRATKHLVVCPRKCRLGTISYHSYARLTQVLDGKVSTLETNVQHWRDGRVVTGRGEDMSQTNFAGGIFSGNQGHVSTSCAKSDAMACSSPVPAGDPAKYAVIVAIPHRISEVDVGKPSDAKPGHRCENKSQASVRARLRRRGRCLSPPAAPLLIGRPAIADATAPCKAEGARWARSRTRSWTKRWAPVLHRPPISDPSTSSAYCMWREGGATVRTNVLLRDLSPVVQNQQDRRIEVIANDLPLWGGLS